MGKVYQLPSGNERKARLLKIREKVPSDVVKLIDDILVDFVRNNITQLEMEKRLDSVLPYAKTVSLPRY